MKHLIISLWIILFSTQSFAYDFYKDTRRKQDAKDAKRWSLSQWLDQKKNIKLMDMWLMYNAPSPYEVFFSFDTATTERTLLLNNNETTENFRNYRGAFGAFVTIVGLYGEYEKEDELEQWKALFMLRLLGSSDQSTHLTLQYGLMNRDQNDDTTQYQVGGARMSLYLLKAFAINGLYEHIFKASSEAEIDSEGSRVEAGAHIEYGALRIYGSWFQEKLEITSPGGQESEQTREGILFGTRVYF